MRYKLLFLVSLVLLFVVVIYPNTRVNAAECSSGTLQNLINSAAPNSVVTVPACIYREAVIVNKSITLDGKGAAEIRGSDIWTGWNKSGTTWVSTLTVPYMTSGGECHSGTTRCKWPEQVYVNGESMLQVGSNPVGKQFALDSSRRVILGTDPTGKSVEVTTRTFWLKAGANNVTVKNFTMKHAGNAAQTGAIGNGDFSYMTIDGGNFSWAHGNNVQLSKGTGHKLLNSDISYGGQQGSGVGGTDNVLVQKNRIHHNHTEDFAIGWSAAGDKSAVLNNSTFDSNIVHNNKGPGLWCDVECNNVTYSNNIVFNNTDEGIFYEISTNGKIFGNKVWGNGFGKGDVWCYSAGILVASSDHTEVYNNTVAWNFINISMLSQMRQTKSNPDGISDNISIRDNFIIGQKGAGEKGLLWCGEAQISQPANNNKGNNNKYWYAEPEGSYQRFGYDGRGIGTLQEFNATLGEENGQYISTTQKTTILQQACMPDVPNGAIRTDCEAAQLPSPTNTPANPTNAPVAKPGDANGDNKVDGLDYVIWLNNYNKTISGSNNGDFNNNNKVDGVDYVIWLNNYGK